MSFHRIGDLAFLPARERSGSGFSITEAMVSVVLVTLVTTALVDALCKAISFCNFSQNELAAGTIVQEVIDNTRNLDYTTLNSIVKNTPITLLVNRTGTTQTGPSFCPNALLLDTSTAIWSSAAQKNSFNGTVTETFASGPVPNSLMVTATCQWIENQNSKRSFNMSTVVSSTGLHN